MCVSVRLGFMGCTESRALASSLNNIQIIHVVVFCNRHNDHSTLLYAGFVSEKCWPSISLLPLPLHLLPIRFYRLLKGSVFFSLLSDKVPFEHENHCRRNFSLFCTHSEICFNSFSLDSRCRHTPRRSMDLSKCHFIHFGHLLWRSTTRTPTTLHRIASEHVFLYSFISRFTRTHWPLDNCVSISAKDELPMKWSRQMWISFLCFVHRIGQAVIMDVKQFVWRCAKVRSSVFGSDLIRIQMFRNFLPGCWRQHRSHSVFKAQQVRGIHTITIPLIATIRAEAHDVRSVFFFGFANSFV